MARLRGYRLRSAQEQSYVPWRNSLARFTLADAIVLNALALCFSCSYAAQAAAPGHTAALRFTAGAVLGALAYVLASAAQRLKWQQLAYQKEPPSRPKVLGRLTLVA